MKHRKKLMGEVILMKNLIILLLAGSLVAALWSHQYLSYPSFSKQRIDVMASLHDTPQIIKQADELVIGVKGYESAKLEIQLSDPASYLVFINGEQFLEVWGNNLHVELPPKLTGRTQVVVRKDNCLDLAVKLIVIVLVVLIFSVRDVVTKDRRILIMLFSGFSLVYVTISLVNSWSLISKTINIPELADKYENSQYVKGEGSPEIIGDADVYTLAGYHYASGADPTSVNFDSPPLGKYVYGFVARATQRPGLATGAYYVICIFVFSQICYLIFADRLTSVAATSILAMDAGLAVFDTMLDLPLTMFILLSYYFYLLAVKGSKHFFLLTVVFIGAAAATKIHFTADIFLLVLLAELIMHHKSKLHPFLIYLPFALVVFLLCYQKFFSNHSIIEFVNFQRWVFSWYRGKTDLSGLGAILAVLTTGQVVAWWQSDAGKVITIDGWSPLWTSYMLVFVYYLPWSVWYKRLNVFTLWLAVYLLFLSQGASNPNQLLVVIPFLIINLFYWLIYLRNGFDNLSARRVQPWGAE